MTRLLVISPAPIKGGAEGYALTVAHAAAQRGWDVQMALPATPGTATMRREIADVGIPVLALPCADDYDTGAQARWRSQSRAIAQIARMLHRVAPDAVHLTIPWPSFALSAQLAAALLGLPTVVVFQLVPDPVPLARGPRVYRFMHRRRQAWVAVSHYGRRLITSAVGLPIDQVEVIYNGVAGAFACGPAPHEERRSVRAELGVAPDARLVVSVGRLHEQKGHRDLIAACSALFALDAGLHLAIAGDGEEEPALRAQSEAAGIADHVHLLGGRDDVSRLLAAGDVFAFPSRFEGLPFSVVEAMASGLPIVSMDFPGAEELIRGGRDGVLVPVGDVAALRAELAALLGDAQARERLGKAARSRAAEFSERQMLERTLGLLTITMAAKQPRVRIPAGRWVAGKLGSSPCPSFDP